MPEISPFPALSYDTKKVPLARAVCPPYDVINRRQRKGYMKKSPYNIVRIVLPQRTDGGRDYLKAKRELYRWIDKGILKKDRSPAIYVYLQEYKIGKRLLGRYGFISLLKLKGKSRREVLPHEKVFSKPLLDRASLIKKTRAHLSPIFIIFRDRKASGSRLLLNTVRKRNPEADINFEGVRHKLWRVEDKPFIDKLCGLIKRETVFIADGHHRFEASLAARDYFISLDKKKRGPDGYSYTLAYLVSSQDKGLTILPTHRAVKKLPPGFNAEDMLKKLSGYFKVRAITAKKVQDALGGSASRGECAFVIYYRRRYFYLVLKDKEIIKRIGPKGSSRQWKRLDVSVLHNLILAKLLAIKEKTGPHRNIYYYKGRNELIRRVNSGEQKLGILLNPTRMEEVEKIAEAGERMPHKSTYFYPKPLTGLLIHKF